MKKILITGYRGFVGRHFWTRLDHDHYLQGIDIEDGADARDFFRTSTERYDMIIHLAAVVGGRMTIEGHPLAVAVDLSIDAEMFNWALRTRPRRIVYYSSSAAYPIWLQSGASSRRLYEDDLVLDRVENPDQTYGWAKLTGEILAAHAQDAGLRVHVFRPFSGYGEDQDKDYPFPAFAERARTRQDPFEVWGNGCQVRDFIHIDDIVEATLTAIDQDVPGPVNLCSGYGIAFNDLARRFMTAAGYNAMIKHSTQMPVGVRYRVGDPTKMESFYVPKIDLRDGIKRALA